MLFVPQLLPGQAVCWERVGSQEPMAPGLCLPPVQAGPLGIAPSPQPTAALMRQVTPPPNQVLFPGGCQGWREGSS